MIASSAPRPGIGALIASLLLPPLGVWLTRGLGPAFWIALVLTCLWYVPGILFALVVTMAPNLLPRRRFG